MGDRHVGPSGEVRPGERRDLDRHRRLPDGEDLRHGMVDRFEEVGHELGPRAHERRVVVGAWVVRAQDEALQVVDVRIEAVGPGPRQDVPCRLRGERRVQEQLAQATGVRQSAWRG